MADKTTFDIKYDSNLQDEIRKTNTYSDSLKKIANVNLESLQKAINKTKFESISQSVKDAIKTTKEEIESLQKELGVEMAIPFNEEQFLETTRTIEELSGKLEKLQDVYKDINRARIGKGSKEGEVLFISKEKIEEAYKLAEKHQNDLFKKIRQDDEKIAELKEFSSNKVAKQIEKLEKDDIKREWEDKQKLEKKILEYKRALMARGMKDESKAQAIATKAVKKHQTELGIGWKGRAKQAAGAIAESKALGGALNLVSGVLMKLAFPLAAIASLAEFISLLIDSHSRMQKLTGDFVDMEKETGDFASAIDSAANKMEALEDAKDHITDLNEATTKTNALWKEAGIKTEEYMEMLKGVASTGLSVKKEITGVEKPILKTVATFHGMLNKSFEETGRMVGELMTDLSVTVDDVRDSFSKVTLDASRSGLGTNRFVAAIQSASTQMSLFGNYLTIDSKLLKGLARTGKLGSKDVMEAFENIQNATKGWSIEQRMFMMTSKAGYEQAKKYVAGNIMEHKKTLEAELDGFLANKDLTEDQGKNYNRLFDIMKKGGKIPVDLQKTFEELPNSAHKSYQRIVDSMSSSQLDMARQVKGLAAPQKMGVFLKTIQEKFQNPNFTIEGFRDLSDSNKMIFNKMTEEFGLAPEALSALGTTLGGMGKSFQDLIDGQVEGTDELYDQLEALSSTGDKSRHTLEDNMEVIRETLQNGFSRVLIFLKWFTKKQDADKKTQEEMKTLKELQDENEANLQKKKQAEREAFKESTKQRKMDDRKQAKEMTDKIKKDSEKLQNSKERRIESVRGKFSESQELVKKLEEAKEIEKRRIEEAIGGKKASLSDRIFAGSRTELSLPEKINKAQKESTKNLEKEKKLKIEQIDTFGPNDGKKPEDIAKEIEQQYAKIIEDRNKEIEDSFNNEVKFLRLKSEENIKRIDEEIKAVRRSGVDYTKIEPVTKSQMSEIMKTGEEIGKKFVDVFSAFKTIIANEIEKAKQDMNSNAYVSKK